MEVKVTNPDVFTKLPEGSVLSIRHGSTRRQAPTSSLYDHTLKFPQKRDSSEHLRIDVLRPVCKETVVLAHDEEKYKFTLAGVEGGEVNIAVTNNDKLIGVKQVAEPAADTCKYQDAAKLARTYLEEHKLLPYFQQLLHTCIQEKPSEPRQFIWEKIGSSLTGEAQGLAGCLAVSQEQLDKMNEAESLRLSLTEQVNKLNSRVAELATLKASQAPVGSEPGELEELRRLRKADNDKWQDCTKQLEEAERTRRELEEAVAKMTDVMQKLVEAQKKNDEAAKEQDRLREETGKAQAETKDANAEQEKLNQEIQRLQALLKEQKAQEKQLDEAEAKREGLTSSVKELTARVKAIQSGVDTKASLEISDGVSPGLLVQLNEAESKRSALEERVNKLFDQIGSGQSSSGADEAKLTAAEEKRDLLEKRVDNIDDESIKKLTAAEEKGGRLEKRIDDMASQIEEMARLREEGLKQLAVAEEKEKMLQDKISKITEKLTQAPPAELFEKGRKELEEAEAKGTQLEEIVKRLNKRLDDVKAFPPSPVGNPSAPSSVPAPLEPPLPSEGAAQSEAELKSYVRQQIELTVQDGRLQQTFNDVAAKAAAAPVSAGSAPSSPLQEQKTKLRQGLEAAYDGGNLPSELQKTGEAKGLLEEKNAIKKGLQLAIQSGRLDAELLKNIPQQQDLENARQTLREHVDKAISDGKLDDALTKTQEEMARYKGVLKEKLQGASNNGTLSGILSSLEYVEARPLP